MPPWSSARRSTVSWPSFGRVDVLRQPLLELSSYDHYALVIEAPYEHFLNPAKVHHWSAAFCARAIADLYARYPRLRVVFCADRKIAKAWTRNLVLCRERCDRRTLSRGRLGAFE